MKICGVVLIILLSTSVIGLAITILIFFGATILRWWMKMKMRWGWWQDDEIFNARTDRSPARVSHTSCCGMCELHWLEGGAVSSLAALALWQRNHSSFGDGGNSGNFKPLVVFSDNMRGHGFVLASYIRRHRLGRVVMSKRKYNPNSGNRVQAWLWSINRSKWEAWVATHVVP